jgi:TonB family protein
VNAASGLRALALLLLVLPLLAQPTAAQHVLVAEDGGRMLLVCSANGTTPCVQKEGKIVPISPHGFALRDVPEFAPYYVSVRNVNVRTTYAMTQEGNGEFNNDFHFYADFETDFRLTDVFVVITLNSDRAGQTLFLWGVGTLEPHRVKGVSIIVPMSSPLGSARYNVHLFSGGAELLQSLLPFGEGEMAMNRMVASRIKDVHNAAPKFFFGPAPVYPPELKKANLRGQAVVSIRIGANGEVFDPSVKSATDPAFGEAALRAIKFWRFLPRVKNDYPVETKVDVPIVFAQPNPAANHS